MANIELELVTDVNLDQALRLLARTLASRAPQSPGRSLAVKTSAKAGTRTRDL
jgi:hypothetical protein